MASSYTDSEARIGKINKLCQEIPCRQKEIELLSSVFGERNQHVPNLFVYGITGTGKSLVVEKIVETLELPHVRVNCIECYTGRLLLELCVRSMQRYCDDDDTVRIRCENMNDFVRIIQDLLTKCRLTDQTFYFILDKAERLRNFENNILPAFLRLQELTDCNICTIFITEIVLEKFRMGTGFPEPFLIHFPSYSKDELIEIMARDAPSEYPVDFYSHYCTLLLNVFLVVCKNLNELRHLALLNFPKYIEPVTSGECNIESSRKLWKNIEPYFKKSLRTVYLREVSSAQWEKMHNKEHLLIGEPSSSLTLIRPTVELPFYSKYLLIGAYLASYNPAKSDRRFFSKNAGKISKRSKLVKKHERTSNQLLGPKPFPLDRLMAIFYSIVEGRVAPTANIFCQISTLVSLQLMSQIGVDGVLDVPKYKCLVSLDFIKQIGRTVQFDVVKYLYDFV